MDEVKQLRLALVLYGGVSLAVYMHGVTKELQRLVRGSALLAGEPGGAESSGEREAAPNAEGDAGSSDSVYRELLRAKAESDGGVRTRVVIDTIAASSAGGINGVYLAKALARDLSQDGLRDVWLTRADMANLVRGPKWVPWQIRLGWVGLTPWHAPLEGGPMCAWLYQALANMDARGPAERGAAERGAAEPTLLPPGHDLEVFVTLTDSGGYSRDVVITDPPVVSQRQHRHVMAFRHGRGRWDFAAGDQHDAALAFAARATSSLPGGFPALSLGAFKQELQQRCGVEIDWDAALSHLFRRYELAGADPQAAYFIDGGLLDNKPFEHVVAALQHKHTAVEVDRQLIYVEPDPAGGDRDRADGQPSPLATLGKAARALGHEAILDEIRALRARNARVRELCDVIESSWPDVAGDVEQQLGPATLATPPGEMDETTWRRWSAQLHALAAQREPAYASYVRTKIADAVDRWASAVARSVDYPLDSHHAAFVARVLQTRARQAGLYEPDVATPTAQQVEFLRDLDLGYRERRLCFLLAGLARWYREADDAGVSRHQLDAASEALSDRLAQVRAAMAGEELAHEVRQRARACFDVDRLGDDVHGGQDAAEAFVARTADELDGLETALRTHLRQRFHGAGAELAREWHRRIADWPETARRWLATRYLGFPLWDARLFPLQRVSGVGEQDEVEIARLSPRDAQLLRPWGCGGELAGATRHHLGAFFTRAGRERDYLWGRLDAAEAMIRMLLGRDRTNEDVEGWCYRAFAAILDEERGALAHASELIECLDRGVARRLWPQDADVGG